MPGKNQKVHPYIPNSEPSVKEELLRSVGAKDIDELYEEIPEEIRFKGLMDLPEPFSSEYELKRHVQALLAKNRTAGENLNFLGAGCYQHHVPAVCDEINGRGEFLTAYAGDTYEDHGRFQALFEYTSMMGELLDMDVVNVPTYDGFQAAATSLRMASRITQRGRMLVCATISSDKLSKLRDYCRPGPEIELVGYDPATGLMDLAALRSAISSETAAVYFENPSYLGFVESRGDEIAGIAHDSGALCIVSVNPSSLGVLAPPAQYGGDIACGDIQPLGMHMQYGGGHGGFIATRDDPAYILEYPSRLIGIAPTRVPGEYGFGDVAFGRTSFVLREEGKEFVGTAASLWGITAGVYLALMGPQGMLELGEGIMARARYAALQIDKIEGIRAPVFSGPHFQEFVVDFNGTGQTVSQINKTLLEAGIFGGKDLSYEFPELGQSALYCVTEVHAQGDLDRLAHSLQEAVR